MCLYNMNTFLKDIVNRSIKGDQLAFKQIYDQFAPQMMGVCMRYTSNREDAQEVLSEGFVRVYEYLHTLKNADTLPAWIYNIMVNTALNFLRKHSVRMERIDDINEGLMPSIDYDQYDVEYLLKAIQSLPDRYRIIFNLHEVEGYSFTEISERLKLTESNVRTLLCRARKLIKDNIKDYE